MAVLPQGQSPVCAAYRLHARSVSDAKRRCSCSFNLFNRTSAR